jgi:hypothetical protein
VVEVDRSGRQDRRRQGKSDPLDAVSAAGPPSPAGAPKGRDGTVEAIRALMVAKRSAAGERTQTMNQVRALVLTGSDERGPASPDTPGCAGGRAGVAAAPAGRCRGYATCIALRELGRRADAALPEAHEGFGSLRRPKASGQPRGRRPGTRAPRRALRPHARPRHTGGLLLRDPGRCICAIAVE